MQVSGVLDDARLILQPPSPTLLRSVLVPGYSTWGRGSPRCPGRALAGRIAVIFPWALGHRELPRVWNSSLSLELRYDQGVHPDLEASSGFFNTDAATAQLSTLKAAEEGCRMPHCFPAPSVGLAIATLRLEEL